MFLENYVYFDSYFQNVWELLFGNLVEYSQCRKRHHFLPWKILEATERLKMTKYLSRACGSWAKEGLIKPQVVVALKSHVYENSENADFAWLLLALVSGHVRMDDPGFVMDYFNTSIHTPEGVGLYTLLQVLRVLFASVSQLEDEQKAVLQTDLLLLVKRFSVPPELISTSIDICATISQLQATKATTPAAAAAQLSPVKSASKKQHAALFDLKVYNQVGQTDLYFSTLYFLLKVQHKRYLIELF